MISKVFAAFWKDVLLHLLRPWATPLLRWPNLEERRAQSTLSSLGSRLCQYLCRCLCFQFVFCNFFEFFRWIYQNKMGRIGYSGNMVLATCAGACMQLITLPLQNHSAPMQAQTEKRGHWQPAVAMYREEVLQFFTQVYCPVCFYL